MRGLGRHSEHWSGEFVSGFQQNFPAATLGFLDLAGSGSEVERQSFLRIDRYVEDLRERSKLTRPVNLLAISMGAMVAAEWASKYPQEINSMILMNASSRGDCRFYERMRPRNYTSMLRMALHKSDLLLRERIILQMTAADLSDIERVAGQYSQLPPASLANFMRQILASSQYTFPEPPPIPALFLAGDRDNLVHPECSRRIARCWRAPVEVHPWAGHDLPLAAPDWVIEKVKNFIDRVL